MTKIIMYLEKAKTARIFKIEDVAVIKSGTAIDLLFQPPDENDEFSAYSSVTVIYTNDGEKEVFDNTWSMCFQ